MIILIISNSDSGLVQFRKELIESLVNMHTVYCAVPNSDGYISELEEIGCKCIETKLNRQGKNPIEDITLLKNYIKYIKYLKPNIVLTYTIKPNIYGGIACRISKIPYIANVTGLGTAIVNGGATSKLALFMYRVGLERAQCVFFQNSFNKEFFIKKRIVRGAYRVIPGSGVNTVFHSQEPYPQDGELFRYLFVGRVMKDKGIGELLSALYMQAKEKKKVFLDIVGSCDEDYSSLISKYENLGLIKYHGHQKDVHKFYTNAHCVVLPSYHEGMANVMLEAASTGRPVITCRIPGCQETFDEGLTGFGCEARNVDSLKEAMDIMINTSWDIRKKMGLSGREKVKKEFDRRIIISAYMDEINKVDL